MDNQEDNITGLQPVRQDDMDDKKSLAAIGRKVLMWITIMRPQSWFAAIAPVLVGMMVSGLLLHDKQTAMEAEEVLREAQFQTAVANGDSVMLNGLGVVITPDTTLLLPMDATSRHFSWGISMVTLLCALAIQIFANLVNDLYDYRRGADAKGRAGFHRGLVEGIITEAQMRRAIYITFAAALVLGLVLVKVGGLPILLIGVSGLLFAWMYTATRYSLAYLGVADIFVFVYFGVLATAGTTLLLTDTWSWQSFLAGGVCGVISICVLACNNLRDMYDDAKVGKKTIIVRFGKNAGNAEMVVSAILSLVFAWTAFGFSLPCLIVLPMLLLAWETLHAQGVEYNKCLIHSGLCNMIFVALVFVMFLIRI